LPPPGDQIDILLELAGVFPDKYKIMWREHAVMHATDPMAQEDPAYLRNAQFMHILTTGGPSTAGDIYVEVGYRFYAHDHEIPRSTEASDSDLQEFAADEGRMNCPCMPASSTIECNGLLTFGNYEFSLKVAYNNQQCPSASDQKIAEEFRRSMQVADRLIALYLKPLRRKAGWL
jgi:hypothetical protein